MKLLILLMILFTSISIAGCWGSDWWDQNSDWSSQVEDNQENSDNEDDDNDEDDDETSQVLEWNSDWFSVKVNVKESKD